ncbi:hypothetical protein VFPPC_18018 [Pochonia chlamydosporia 170]|uniref:Uncharacterized protein n=1 Tax=Pochonia chlamydosporia 170 TaxID=1380566 RepID=A0A219APQ5_METCM|nr:hypothetical protein VFPPC_18018 [Pochonia chlamydosporia 170]OWT42763.1 hypothetical protein VFPPC_18018 [Pochonia chlamydosporia 170]
MMCPTREALPVEKCRLHAVRIASKGSPLRPPRAHRSVWLFSRFNSIMEKICKSTGRGQAARRGASTLAPHNPKRDVSHMRTASRAGSDHAVCPRGWIPESAGADMEQTK